MPSRFARPLAVALLLAGAPCVRAEEGRTSTSTSTSTPTPTSTSTSTSTPTSTPTPTSTSTPTSTARPKPLPPPVSRAVAVEPSGPAPLSRGGETVVDPASSFEIELPARLVDVRLVLLDAGDAHVPARGTREVGATTRLVLAPAAPLVPGSRYVLRVEGATSRELREAGGTFGPLSFALLTAGTPPPPEPKAKPKKKHRRR